MLDETRAGTAMLTLQLRTAVQEAVQAEASFGDRDSARDELRGRLTVLVDRRRTDLAAELAAERQAAARRIDAARREAAVIVEAAVLVGASTLVVHAPAAPVNAVDATMTVAPGLHGRARGAQLGLQLRTAMREAADAERDEAIARQVRDHRQHAKVAMEQRRRDLDDGITGARGAAAALVSAARVQAAALVAAAANEGSVAETEPELPEVEAAEIVAAFVVPAVVVPAVVREIVREIVPEPAPAPAQQLPINVVIDAEAFARVLASVFATMFDERVAAWGSSPQMPQPYPTQPYPTQMYSVGQFALSQPTPTPVKQSFWSHAKHVDVLLLSAAMVIVLVVLGAWLV